MQFETRPQATSLGTNMNDDEKERRIKPCRNTVVLLWLVFPGRSTSAH